MRRRFVHLVVITAFALTMGQFAWFTLGPAGGADYVVGGDVETLQAPQPEGKNLYLRRTLYLPQPARRAWVRLLGFDYIQLYVNGTMLERQHKMGLPVAIVADLTPYLRPGKNVLGVVARQENLTHPPRISVEGAYWLEDGEHRIDTKGPWRCSTVFDRGSVYWYSVRFDDSRWPVPRRSRTRIVATVATPPRALTTPDVGRWIAPTDSAVPEICMRRCFPVPERIDHAWVRLHTTAPYRLAINGTVVDTRHQRMGTASHQTSAWWIYDVSPLIGRGDNVVSLLLNSEHPPAHLTLDLEAEGRSGRTYRIATDADWRWRRGHYDWLASRVDDADWRACHVETGDMGIPPWRQMRRLANFELPSTFRARRLAYRIAASLSLWIVVWLMSRLVDGATIRNPRSALFNGSGGISPAVLSLVPSAVLAAGAVLAVYDSRVAAQWVYRPAWLLSAGALVAGQWALLSLRGFAPVRSFLSRVAARRSAGVVDQAPAARPPVAARRRGVVWWAMLILIIAGGYLRLRDIAARPLSPDEVTMHRATMGFLEYGFPGIVIHEDLPVAYRATSELVYVGPALAALVFDNERLVVRAPAAVWGIVTIFLIYWVSKKMFNPWVGVIAASIYTFSHYCAGMANSARYYSQLQAFTLLTVYFFWRTIEARGALNRKALWITVGAFACMYLSWEGSALLTPGLIVAALIHRRGRVRTLFCDPHVWSGAAVVGAVVSLQWAHRAIAQTMRPLFGTGASEVSTTAMWEFPRFDLWYYVWSASWNRDTLLPMLGLAAAAIMAVRHPFRKPARILLIVLLGTCFVQAFILPVTAKRYSYALVPLWIIPAAAALFAMARALAGKWPAAPRRQLPSSLSVPSQLRGSVLHFHARSIGVLAIVVFVALGSGMVVDLSELRGWRIPGKGLRDLKTPYTQSAALYVKRHLQADDVVMVNQPHVVNQYLAMESDYWLQTQLRHQATFDDVRPLPLHRLAGAVLLPDLEHVKHVFDRHRRVWFVVDPTLNGRTNVDETSEFIRRNMDVVYEDFSSMVLFRGDKHLSAALRDAGERSLKRTRGSYLP